MCVRVMHDMALTACSHYFVSHSLGRNVFSYIKAGGWVWIRFPRSFFGKGTVTNSIMIWQPGCHRQPQAAAGSRRQPWAADSLPLRRSATSGALSPRWPGWRRCIWSSEAEKNRKDKLSWNWHQKTHVTLVCTKFMRAGQEY